MNICSPQPNKTSKTFLQRLLLVGVCLSLFMGSFSPALVYAVPAGDRTDVVSEDDDAGGGIGLGGAIEGIIYSFAVGVGGIFLWIGGSLLDYSIQFLVVGMGEFLKANLGVVVDQLWTVVRDFFNIIFIFGLIYIGFQTILGINKSGTRKALGLLIVAALMMNFSLFITKAIIDFSNIAAFQVHNALIAEGRNVQTTLDTGVTTTGEGDNLRVNRGGTQVLGGDAVTSISGSFMNAINFTTYADGSAINQMREGADFISGRFIFFGIVMMFFMIFAAFVFAAGAFILIARFIALVIFMIFSPMMFLGLIFPMLGKFGKDWWTRFLKYAFVAPAYLFMLYLSLWAISGIASPDGGSFAQAFAGDSPANGTFFIFLYFFVIIGFLVASLKVANLMGAHGAGAAVGATKYFRQGAGAMSFGLAARGFRNTVGYGAQKLADDNNLKEAASKSGASGYAARALLRASGSVGNSSFDVRNVVDTKLGKGKKGGYKTQRDLVAKRELEFAENLGEVSDEDETVKGIAAKITSKENDLTKLKNAENPDSSAIQIVQSEIKELENMKKREKARRQIGRQKDYDDYDKAVKERDKVGDELDSIVKKNINIIAGRDTDISEYLEEGEKADYEAMSAKEQKKFREERINNIEKTAAAQYRKFAREASAIRRKGSFGYANVLETSNFAESAVMGRIVDTDRNAGAAIRKKYDKQIKRTDTEKQFEGLAEVIKASAKAEE